EDSAASLPPGLPDFLQPESFLEWRRFCELDPSADAALLAGAERVRTDPALLRLTWHCYRRLYHHTDSGGFNAWPDLESVLGDLAGVPYLLVTLAMVPLVRQAHAAMGVPDDVTRETCLQAQSFSLNYRDAHRGRWGVFRNQLYWLRHYPACRLFRLGRFEFMLQPFSGAVEVYRRRDTGQALALSEDGVRYDAQGYRPINDAEPEGGFTGQLRHGDGLVEGTPISPLGMAIDRTVRLDLTHWEPVLKRGDTVLDMHIPAGGNMTPERAKDSFERAVRFFAEQFPDRPAHAIACGSWIYNTQFEELLGPEANLVKHMREVYLFPIASSGRDGLWFLFYTDDVDPATARRDSSVRRAVLDHLAAGKHLRAGGMFMLTCDVCHYGTQWYRQNSSFE
ncbi:MAG TPA: acyltransferase domain-containing protein, partial [Armatimonadota bacterium]|nr:acyltransferase domain-containing protein [Armatimonadota bacterium]